MGSSQLPPKRGFVRLELEEQAQSKVLRNIRFYVYSVVSNVSPLVLSASEQGNILCIDYPEPVL